MKLRSKIVGVSCLALIFAGAVIWHFVHAELIARRLANNSAACRIRAEQGDAESQFRLGSMYSKGQGVPMDYVEAVRWYRKSAEQGYAPAQYDLGYMYYYGYGVPQDRVEANRLFHQSAAQGNEDARRTIGLSKVHMPAISKIVLPLKLLASFFFGVVFLKSGREHRSRAQIATGVAALMLLSAFVLDLFWYSYIGHLQSSTTVTVLYFMRHFVGGLIVAMLAYIVHAKSAKIILIAAAALFLGFTLFGIVRSEIKHIPLTIHFLCFVSFPIGMSVPSAILLWLDRKRKDRGWTTNAMQQYR